MRRLPALVSVIVFVDAMLRGALGRALRDRACGGGPWLNLLPAFRFGVGNVLVPPRLDEGGWGSSASARSSWPQVLSAATLLVLAARGRRTLRSA